MFERKTYSRFFASLRMTAMLVFAYALAGCAKVGGEIRVAGDEPVPVTFTTYSVRTTGSLPGQSAIHATKADPAYYIDGSSVTNIPAGKSFGVFAWYHDGSDWDTDKASLAPNFMYDQVVTNNGTASDPIFEYSPIKYWPNETGAGAASANIDRLSFWAYYPRNAAGLNIYKPGTTDAYDNNTPGIPKAAFTVNSDISQQVDLLFSLPEKDLTKPGISESVQLKFRHALSLVQFNITAGGGSLPEGAEVAIKSITLTNVNCYGVCDDPSASIASDSDAALYWTSVGTPDTISLPDASSDANLILMPQTLAQEGSTGHSAIKLNLTYDIKFPAADNPAAFITYTDNETEAYLWRDTAPAYGVKTWLPGRKYIYNVTAGLDEIEFSEVFTEDWTLESTTNL